MNPAQSQAPRPNKESVMCNRQLVPLGLVLIAVAAACSTANRHVTATAAADVSVRQHGTSPGGQGVTRTYYIAADEVQWDYAPTGTNLTEGRPFNDEENLYMVPGTTGIGHKVKKAIYREYTDGTFTQLKPRTKDWEHLGFLGPLMRAEVGDTLRVVFKNNTKFPATVHPHNVAYDKKSEGALYGDGTSGERKADDAVAPGSTYTYIWTVPERAGPSEHEGSSMLSMYHSHSDEVRDVASGLLGPIIITGRGMSKPDGTPKDVDREFVAGFISVDENSSWYVEDNVTTLADRSKVKITMGRFFNLAAYPDADRYFRDTINGYAYGHTPGIVMKVGERVRWYLMASTNIEFHTPHWHGNVVMMNHMRTDVAFIAAMGMAVADMVPDNPGKWLLHCHVGNHMRVGMSAFYIVEPAISTAQR
jgi:FtsP/CotA-like multicopper oxidase with cupredoxin domain